MPALYMLPHTMLLLSLVFLQFISILALDQRSFASDKVSTTDYNALEDLYDATDGAFWIWEEPYELHGLPWNFTGTSDPCGNSWQGVTCVCNAIECNVESLSLQQYNLTGSLPESIGDLSLLLTLKLSINNLVGSIPESIYDIAGLVSLDLSGNNITGTLSPNIAKLTVLTDLSLLYNGLTGTLPNFGGIPLEFLLLGYNNFTGTLPETIGDCTKLQMLSLSDNDFTGKLPESIGNCTQLTYLELNDNRFSGTLPTVLGKLTQLYELELTSNAFSGSLSDELFINCDALVNVYVTVNYFTGTLPITLVNCVKLGYLDASNNYFTGSLPNVYGSFSGMRQITISTNLFTGTLPSSFGNLTNMNLFLGDNNAFTGPIPETLFRIQALEELKLNYNGFSGQLPFQNNNATNLENFDGSFNYFSGTLSRDINTMRILQVLNLQANSVTGSVPTGLESKALLQLQLGENLLSGTLPEDLGNLSSLTLIHLQDNFFIGTLPKSIAQMTQMLDFGANNNHLTGTIPTAFCNMTLINDIVLGFNEFTGTIPNCITTLNRLFYIELDSNLLTGNIPNALGDMRAILGLSISQNYITGSIPNSVTNAALMYELTLDNNLLTGTVPNDIFHLHILGGLVLNNNLLTGPLPNATVDMNYMQTINVNYNSFTGTIPESYYRLTLVYNFDTSVNMLTGSVPCNVVANFSGIVGYDLSSNFFTGSIPTEIVSNVLLRDAYFNDNYFTSTIPAEIVTLKNLSQVFMGNNLLTGTIPKDIGMLHNLSILSLSNNFLSGSLPTDFSSSMVLFRFNTSDNLIIGGIPESLADAMNLQYIDFSSNLLTGTVPSSFASLTLLEELFLNENQLTGSLESVFGGSSQNNLTTVDVSFNQLTGSIPAIVFYSAALASFTAVSNCFTGTLPTSLCSSASLQVVALDGASAASSCQTRFFPHTDINTYYIPRGITGSIPNCYFAVPTLATLHLSGNGLSGKLPDAISTSLLDLSLSNNRLSGSIPGAFQAIQWNTFDLSYNKFTGILSTQLSVAQDNTSSLSLEVNRLSGNMPQTLKNIQNINILDSNMFTCNPNKSTLPPADTNYNDYQCGSNAFNLSVYLWLGVVFIAAVIAITLCFIIQPPAWYTKVLQNIARAQSMTSSNVRQLMRLTRSILRYVVPFAIAVAALFIAVYGVLTYFYHTYQFEYAWTVSAAYLCGIYAGVVLIVLLSAVLATIECYARFGLHSTNDTTTTAADVTGGGTSAVNRLTDRLTEVPDLKTNNPARKWLRVIRMTAISIANFTATVAVNAAYVYIVINFSSFAGTLMQIAVALYKLLWNRIVVPKILYLLTKDGRATSPTIMFLFLMELFNNIIAPCVATALISSSCLYNVFVTPPSVSSSYSYSSCADVDVLTAECLEYTTASTTVTYTPPFIYSYQCSSTLIKEYAPVYVYMFLFIAFGKPLLLSAAEYVSTFWPTLELLLPPINRRLTPQTLSAAAGEGDNIPLFDKALFLLSVYTHLAVMMTFGVVFPPLCFVIGLSLVSHTYYTEFIVGRVVAAGEELSLFTQLEDILSSNLRKLLFTVAPAVLIMARFAAFFYSLFIFDIMGDSLGWKDALTGMIVMLVMPYLVQAVAAVWHTRKNSRNDTADVVGFKEETAGDVERSSARTASVPYTVYGSSVDHINKQHAAFAKNPMAPQARGESEL